MPTMVLTCQEQVLQQQLSITVSRQVLATIVILLTLQIMAVAKPTITYSLTSACISGSASANSFPNVNSYVRLNNVVGYVASSIADGNYMVMIAGCTGSFFRLVPVFYCCWNCVCAVITTASVESMIMRTIVLCYCFVLMAWHFFDSLLCCTFPTIHGYIRLHSIMTCASASDVYICRMGVSCVYV